MFCAQVEAALAVANLRQIDDLIKATYRALLSGSLSEEDVEKLTGQAEVRRIAIRGVGSAPAGACAQLPSPTAQEQRPPLPRHLYPARRRQSSPDRARSMARRRTLATAGVLPPTLARHFTMGELAVLHILASEAGCTRQCDCSIAEIAARAGVGRTTVQNAVRRAQDLGLIVMTERRRPGRPNETNLVRIISAEWKQWIAHGGRRSTSGVGQTERAFWKKHRGFKKTERTVNPSGIKEGRPTKNRSKRPFGPPAAVA